MLRFGLFRGRHFLEEVELHKDDSIFGYRPNRTDEPAAISSTSLSPLR
jgi:hypothetical protein